MDKIAIKGIDYIPENKGSTSGDNNIDKVTINGVDFVPEKKGTSGVNPKFVLPIILIVILIVVGITFAIAHFFFATSITKYSPNNPNTYGIITGVQYYSWDGGLNRYFVNNVSEANEVQITVTTKNNKVISTQFLPLQEFANLNPALTEVGSQVEFNIYRESALSGTEYIDGMTLK